jgi:hypothetical protein
MQKTAVSFANEWRARLTAACQCLVLVMSRCSLPDKPGMTVEYQSRLHVQPVNVHATHLTCTAQVMPPAFYHHQYTDNCPNALTMSCGYCA